MRFDQLVIKQRSASSSVVVILGMIWYYPTQTVKGSKFSNFNLTFVVIVVLMS